MIKSSLYFYFVVAGLLELDKDNDLTTNFMLISLLSGIPCYLRSLALLSYLS